MRQRGIWPRFLALLLAAGSVLAAGPAWAASTQDRSFQMTPFYGYRFGGDISNVEDADSAQVAEGSSYGIMLDWEVEKDAFVELRYSLQRTQLQARGTPFGAGLADVADIDIEHYFLGGTYEWENETQFLPFVSADLGVVHFSPDGSTSETRFAFALGGGVKASVAKHTGLRFDGRWVLSRISGETEMYCSSAGQCLVVGDGTFFSQVELSAGLMFKF